MVTFLEKLCVCDMPWDEEEETSKPPHGVDRFRSLNGNALGVFTRGNSAALHRVNEKYVQSLSAQKCITDGYLGLTHHSQRLLNRGYRVHPTFFE